MLCGISSRFQLLSPTQGQVAHALLTRPPLSNPRRNCSVRLECVMHAASVHPEPGSNSQTNCISSAFAVWFVWAIYLSFLYFFRVVFSLVLTDFVSHLLFALYFFYLLFNCQVSISTLSTFVREPVYYITEAKRCQELFEFFFKTPRPLYASGVSVAFSRQLAHYTTIKNTCQ